MSKSIAIIGAGPGGLTTALALARRGGFEITVYEREEDHMTAPRFNPDRSYTIDITGHGLNALKHCDATQRFDKDLLKFKGLKIRFANKIDEWNDEGWTGSRGDICRALQAEITERYPGKVKFAFKTKVDVVDVFDGTLSITPDGGQTTQKSVDLIVGCDGAGAVSRAALEKVPGFTVESHQHPNYCTMLPFDPKKADALDPRYLEIFAFDPFVVGGAINGPDGNKSARWFCLVGFDKHTTFANVEEARTYLAKATNKDILQYVSDKEIAEFVKRPCNNIGRAKICSSYHTGKLVMVGDSGNPFPPIGQGINHAMEAATVLDKCIGACVNEGKRLEFAAAAFTATWKPEGDAINWIARRVDFGDKFKMFLVKFALAFGFSVLSESKRGDIPYQEVAAKAKGRLERAGIDIEWQNKNRFLMPTVMMLVGVGAGLLMGRRKA